VWIGTGAGHIQVFCALTYKPVAFCLLGYRVILKILHSPVCGLVLVSLSDGSIYAFDDNISKYNETIPQNEVVERFDRVDRTTVIRKLVERSHFTSDSRIHCMACVPNYAIRQKSQEIADNAVTKHDNADKSGSRTPSPHTTTTTSDEPMYELWCGHNKEQITIYNIKTLQLIQTLPVSDNDLAYEFNETFNIQFLETSRAYDSTINNNNNTLLNPPASPSNNNRATCVWVVAYPDTKVSRWNVDNRAVERTIDAAQYSPWHDCK